MRALEDLSGPWAGWWVQGDRRGTMKLRLHFENGVIRGTGRDIDGGFEMMGTWRGTSVVLAKGYADLTVRYLGNWDGTTIAGIWRIAKGDLHNEGPFEIWPESDEMSMLQFMEMTEEVEVPEERPFALPGPSLPSRRATRAAS